MSRPDRWRRALQISGLRETLVWCEPGFTHHYIPPFQRQSRLAYLNWVETLAVLLAVASQTLAPTSTTEIFLRIADLLQEIDFLRDHIFANEGAAVGFSVIRTECRQR
jgi:hypothetical protein